MNPNMNPNTYTGGDGSSQEQAIIPDAKNTVKGVFMESYYAEKTYPEAEFESQMDEKKDEKIYDVLNYTLPDGSKITLYFDISNFYGKHGR